MGRYFNESQKALYEAVKGGTLDQQLIKLSELAAQADPDDVKAVRRWLSDQVIRETAR